MMRSDLKKVITIVLASASVLSATSLAVINHTEPTLAEPQTAKVISVANTNQNKPLPSRFSTPISGLSSAKTQIMFSDGHQWLKIGYNQWGNDSHSSFQYVPATDNQPELLSDDNAIERPSEALVADAPTNEPSSQQTSEATQPQVTPVAETSQNQSSPVTTSYETTTTSTASVNVVPEATSDQPTANTLKIAGYTVKYLDNVADTPSVNDGSNYNNLPLQNWLNEQTAGVWNINANSGNHINNQALSTFSTTDNRNSYFIGHNIGALTPLMYVNDGDTITATDSTNNTKNYRVSAIYRLPANNSGNQWIDMDTGENVFDKVLYAGDTEKITLQTCIDQNSIRIVVADAN